MNIIIFVGLASCTCTNPLIVSEIQKTDKKLSCKEVILEINEAEHYRDLARKDVGIRFGNALMPVCWVSSYVYSTKAVSAAEERIRYLGQIYDVLDCGGKSGSLEPSKSADAVVAPFVAPPLLQIQPVPEAKAASPLEKSNSAKFSQCGNPAEKEKYTHQHVDRLGKVYTHCHYNKGPHRHLDN